MDEFMREGVDMKRFFLQSRKRLWMTLPAILIGMLVFGGGYLMARFVFSDPVPYRSEALCYISFDTSEAQETQLYYNDYTWNAVLDSDEIAGHAADDSGIPKEEIAAATFIPTMSDIRMIRIRFDSATPERSEEIRTAVLGALSDFAVRTEGFRTIETWDLVPPYLPERENLVGRWLILGAFLGCVAGVLFLLYRSAMDAYVGCGREEDI